jgi:hypothetical protein
MSNTKFLQQSVRIDKHGGEIRCPFGTCGNPQCEGVPHIIGVSFGRNVPPASSSGPGLTVEFFCENLHHWQLQFIDHSGGTWVSLFPMPDLSEDPRL